MMRLSLRKRQIPNQTDKVDKEVLTMKTMSTAVLFEVLYARDRNLCVNVY